uniref:Small ribosomal subunit protein uS5 n=1 Tax=Picea sitchensis TaxID=3332 RepID=A9NRU6_PICSI|nr:unknown [Picea sitchensis]
MGARDEARPPGKRRQNPFPRANLSLLVGREGAPDRGGHARSPVEGRGHEDHACAKTDEGRAEDSIQGLRCCGRRQWSRRARGQVQQEVATAIRGAIILAKLSVIPVRRGYWGNKIGKPHTVPVKVTGKCGSVTVRMVPAPRGAGIVAARVPKKVLQFAGIEDVFTSSRGSTKTLGNFVKATFECLLKTYGFLTPDLWRETRFSKSPFQEYTDLLAKPAKALILEDVDKEALV